MSSHPEQRFTLTVPRVVGAAGSALFILIAISMMTLGKPGDRWFGLGLLLVFAYFFVRSVKSATVVLRPSEVRLQSIFRTRRVPLAELSGAGIAVGRTGFNGIGRQYLVLQRKDGGQIKFTELNANPRRGVLDGPSVVEAAANAIDAAVGIEHTP